MIYGRNPLKTGLGTARSAPQPPGASGRRGRNPLKTGLGTARIYFPVSGMLVEVDDVAIP